MADLISRVFFNRLIDKVTKPRAGKIGYVVEVDFCAHRDRLRQPARALAAYANGRQDNIFTVGFVLHQVHYRSYGFSLQAGDKVSKWGEGEKILELRLKLCA